MNSLDFEEFLWAKRINEEVINYLKDCFKNKIPISKATHEAMLRYFQEYICVGGLPESVNTLISTGDMNQVYLEQKDILGEYQNDFGKHLNSEENEEVDEYLLSRINEVFDSIPSQLAKEIKISIFKTKI